MIIDTVGILPILGSLGAFLVLIAIVFIGFQANRRQHTGGEAPTTQQSNTTKEETKQ